LRGGDLLSAQKLAEEGLAHSGSGNAAAWDFRLLRAESLILQLKIDDARPDLVATLPEGSAFDSLRARQKFLQARAQIARGKLADALTAIEEARPLPAPKDVRRDLSILEGQIKLRQGQRTEAEALLRSVIADSAAAGDRYHEASASNDLGMGRLVNKRFDEALPWFEHVIGLKGIDSLTIYSVSLYNAGICYAELGDYERAFAVQRQAVSVYERRGPPVRLEQALGELGRSYLIQGHPDESLPYLQRAFDIAKSVGATADMAKLAGNLSEALASVNRWDEAERYNNEATTIRQAQGTERVVWNTLNAASISAGRGQIDRARQLFESAVASSTGDPAARWDAYAGLARTAIAQGHPDRAAESFEQALDIIEQTRADLLKTDYKLSYLASLIQFYREYVDVLITQHQTDRALEVADSSRGRVLAERQRSETTPRLSVTSLRQLAARSGKTFLFYWLQPTQSWLWVVSGKDVHLVAIDAADRIEAMVKDYRTLISSAVGDPLSSRSTSGDRLYAALVAPAARWIPPGSSIVIVPDGALHALNFETLPVDGPKRHYWIEDVQIQIAPSLGLLMTRDVRSAPAVRTARDQRTPRSLLLFGAPTDSDPQYPSLSYATAEMAKVSRHFDPNHVVSFSGATASPAAYRSANLDRFTNIHFTAHAAANVESPLDSAVILSSEHGAYKLYARDVADLPLRADLVTVSACRSAGERTYSGEGLVGFAWAFLRAGAKRVIAGLWDVDDQSTANLMDALYANLAAGEPPAEALRKAKLAMMQLTGLEKPYYWGPFELFTVAP
jgi:CHAT domain-containing protein